MHYYGTRLSENISRRPEGYLLCLNVPVARSGTQEYLPEELGIPAPSPGPPAIPVYRPEEEVFSPETIASFEGMPVTNDHPPDGVSIDNIRALQKGHAQNVRRGTGEDADLLLADLMITDSHLIHLILEEGKREISCGYTYELCQEDDRFIQRKIRGNHIAVVDAGRAGPRVSIKDSEPTSAPVSTVPLPDSSAPVDAPVHPTSNPSLPHPPPAHTAASIRPPISSRKASDRTDPFRFSVPLSPKNRIERRPIKMKKSLYRKLLRMARDGDAEAIEAIAEVAEALLEPETPDVNVTVVNQEPAAQPAVPVATPAAAQSNVPVAAAQPVAPVLVPAQVAAPAPAAAAGVPTPAVSDPAATITTPEGNEVVVDGDTLTEILYRLDRLIDLLAPANPPLAVNTPVPADCGTPTASRDDQLKEEIAEAVEEAMEAVAAAPETATPAPLDPPADPAEALSTLVAEALEPTQEDLEAILSSVLEPDEEEKEPSLSDTALRGALNAIRPRLKKMSPGTRNRVVKDLAARINYLRNYSSESKLYNSAGVSNAKAADAATADLGKRIMARRNVNYNNA